MSRITKDSTRKHPSCRKKFDHKRENVHDNSSNFKVFNSAYPSGKNSMRIRDKVHSSNDKIKPKHGSSLDKYSVSLRKKHLMKNGVNSSYMTKRKRMGGKDKLKSKFSSILPNSVQSHRKDKKQAINLNTSTKERLQQIAENSYELNTNKLHTNFQDHRFISESDLEHSPNFRRRLPDVQMVYYGMRRGTLPTSNMSSSSFRMNNCSASKYSSTEMPEKSRNIDRLDIFKSSFSTESDSGLSTFTRMRNHMAKTDMDKYNRSQDTTSLGPVIHQK